MAWYWTNFESWHKPNIFLSILMYLVLGIKIEFMPFLLWQSHLSLFVKFTVHCWYMWYWLGSSWVVESHTCQVKVQNKEHVEEIKLNKKEGLDVKHSICSWAELKLTWLILLPQGELKQKCSLTMKWSCSVMVVNGCMLQKSRVLAGGMLTGASCPL